MKGATPTPTPWHAATREMWGPTEPGSVAVVTGSMRAVFARAARGDPEEDLKLILTAVNAHEGLMDALKAIAAIARTPPQSVADRTIVETAEKALREAGHG